MMDDASLISAHQTGDPKALSALMARHRPELMGFLSNRVGHDAEDLFQETWSRAAQAMPSYREQGTFKGWLYQIARRLIIDHHRRAGARIRLVLDEDSALHALPSTTRPDQSMAAQQVAAVLQTALDQMTTEMAEVVRLRLIDGVPFKEIATRQGVPLNTALGRMHRALQRLRQDLITAEIIQPGSTP